MIDNRGSTTVTEKTGTTGGKEEEVVSMCAEAGGDDETTAAATPPPPLPSSSSRPRILATVFGGGNKKRKSSGTTTLDRSPSIQLEDDDDASAASLCQEEEVDTTAKSTTTTTTPTASSARGARTTAPPRTLTSSLSMTTDYVDDATRLEYAGGRRSSCRRDDHDEVVEKERDRGCGRWREAYVPPPVVSKGTILAIGFGLFVLASIWPPLLLIAAYLASKLIPYTFRVNDDAAVRRQFLADFNANGLPARYRNVIPSNVRVTESFWRNSRGMMLSTSIMRPQNVDKVVKAVVCFCHGYTDDASEVKRAEYVRLCNAGMAVVCIEYEGHGPSDGLLGLIPDFRVLVEDVSTYFAHAVRSEFGKDHPPVFLMGESMGGAVAYSVYNHNPSLYRGVVFVAPMCKIAPDMLPPDWVIRTLLWILGPSGSTSFLANLPIAPGGGTDDFASLAYKCPLKRDVLYRTPITYGRNPRLATARELILTTRRISETCADFSAPFLVVHGKEDRVTDPAFSQALYRESKSTDKSIKLYDGMWHALTSAEPDDNIDRVFEDCIDWILERS